MMAFYGMGSLGAAFYDIRINRTLDQIINFAKFPGFFFKYPNKFFSDNLALSFRITYTGQFA